MEFSMQDFYEDINDILEFNDGLTIEDVIKNGELNFSVWQYISLILEQLGYKPINVRFGSGYLAPRYLGSVVWFNVEHLHKSWRFGCWINTERIKRVNEKDEYEDSWFISLFCQNEHTIDKFKPSRSDMCVTFYKSDFQNLINNDEPRLSNWEIHRIKEMLTFIKKHPILAYYGYCSPRYEKSSFGNFLVDYPIKYLVKNEYRLIIDNLKNEVEYVIASKYILMKLKQLEKYDIVDHIKYVPSYWNDKEAKGIVFITENATDDQVCNMVNEVFKYSPFKELSNFLKYNHGYCGQFEFRSLKGGSWYY